MEIKTSINQYLTLIPYSDMNNTKLDGTEIKRYGDLYRVPTSGVTDVLEDCGSFFKYDFGSSELILCDIEGNEVFKKNIPLQAFLSKQCAWLGLCKREAVLKMNLSEEILGEYAYVLEEKEEGKMNKYYGYIDEDGDVVDMTCADESGVGARLLTVEELIEETGGKYEVNEEGEIFTLNEGQLPKSSNPEEGKVYWNKKHDTAYIVVAVYPDQKDAKKQVSYWNDEGTRLTCSIEDFKKNMVPSKDVDDYDIFEECDTDEGFEISEDMHEETLDETAGLIVDKKATNAKAFTVEINGKKYSYYPTEESGLTAKELGQKYSAIAKYSIGKALAWLKKNATTKDSYKTK